MGVGVRGHDLRRHAHTAEGVVRGHVDARPARSTRSPRWASSGRWRSAPGRRRGRGGTATAARWCTPAATSLRASSRSMRRCSAARSPVGTGTAHWVRRSSRSPSSSVAADCDAAGRRPSRTPPAGPLREFPLGHVPPGQIVISDGWPSYPPACEGQYKHRPEPGCPSCIASRRWPSCGCAARTGAPSNRPTHRHTSTCSDSTSGAAARARAGCCCTGHSNRPSRHHQAPTARSWLLPAPVTVTPRPAPASGCGRAPRPASRLTSRPMTPSRPARADRNPYNYSACAGSRALVRIASTRTRVDAPQDPAKDRDTVVRRRPLAGPPRERSEPEHEQRRSTHDRGGAEENEEQAERHYPKDRASDRLGPHHAAAPLSASNICPARSATSDRCP